MSARFAYVIFVKQQQSVLPDSANVFFLIKDILNELYVNSIIDYYINYGII